MAGDATSDILMKFTHKGMTIAGESGSEVNAQGRVGREMLTGFRRNGMFEIDSFGFGVGEPGTEDEEDKKKKKTAKDRREATPKGAGLTAASKVSVQPVTFSRVMDRASTELMRHFVARTMFGHAALVKRKSAGSTSAGEPYLRFDFKGVLITNVAWTNDDPIKEDFTFYARAIAMRYRPQLPDGTLGAIISGFWSMAPDEKLEPPV